MARFSIGAAIGDAFGLIRRRPVSVFVWGLLLIAPALGSAAMVLPAMGEIFANMPMHGQQGPDDVMAAPMVGQMMQFQLASMLLNIGQLLMSVLVYTAIFRAVVRPRESGFFYLRIGMDELRVAVVGLAIGIGLYVAMLLLVILGLVVGFAVSTAGDTAVLVGVVCVMVLVMVVAMFLALARVSLMAPASVLYRDFAFVQGWRLAAGKMWPLFGLMIVVFLTILVIEAVVFAVAAMIFLAGGATTGINWMHMDPAGNPFAGMDTWLVANWYWAVLGGVLASVVYGVVLTLAVAPFASACRQLAGSETQPRADDPSPAAAA